MAQWNWKGYDITDNDQGRRQGRGAGGEGARNLRRRHGVHPARQPVQRRQAASVRSTPWSAAPRSACTAANFSHEAHAGGDRGLVPRLPDRRLPGHRPAPTSAPSAASATAPTCVLARS
ncbi:MAG: hypothetical protein MZW92_39310 [Comamonadaceae bacterium]|nr:hypothetical protein [Comamonadaceae bacterium]